MDLDISGLPGPDDSSLDISGLPGPQSIPAAPKSLISDYAKSFQQGMTNVFNVVPAQLATMVGGSRAPLERAQQTIKNIGEGISPAGQLAASAPVYDTDKGEFGPVPWQSLGMKAAQSAPSVIQALQIGGPIAQGMAANNVGNTVARAAQRMGLPEKAAGVVGRATNALPLSAVEGVQAGAMGAADIGQEARSRPMADFAETEPFKQALAATDANLPLDQRMEMARNAVINQAERASLGKTALSTGLLGLVTGGGALGPLVRRFGGGATKNELADGLIKTLFKEGGKETFQETLQSGGEQAVANLVAKQYYDPARDPWNGVIQQAVEGGIVGGAMGGAMGGAGYMAHPRRNDRADPVIQPPGTPAETPPGSVGAPPGAAGTPPAESVAQPPPVVEHAPPVQPGPVSNAVLAGQESGAIPTNPIGGPVDAHLSAADSEKSSLEEIPVSAFDQRQTWKTLPEVEQFISQARQQTPGIRAKPVQRPDGGFTFAIPGEAQYAMPDASQVAKSEDTDKLMKRAEGLTKRLMMAGNAADKAREDGNEAAAESAEALAGMLRDQLSSVHAQLRQTQGDAGADTIRAGVPGPGVGAGIQGGIEGTVAGGNGATDLVAGGAVLDVGAADGASERGAGGVPAVPVQAGDAGSAGAVDQQLTPEIIEPEAFSDGPTAAPGPRWTADRGATPGEPFAFLDGGPDTAPAAMIAVEIPGRGVYYEVRRAGGDLVASGSTPQEAAQLAEKLIPPLPPAKLVAGNNGTQARRRALANVDPFKAFLGEYGISVKDRSDVGGEKRGHMIQHFGPLFRKAGPRLDELAMLAVERGFMTQADLDSDLDNGGVNKFSDMVRRMLAGEKIPHSASAESLDEQALEAQMQARYDAMDEAEQAIVDDASDDEINALLQLASDEDAEASNEEIDYIAGQDLAGEAQESAAGVEARGDLRGSAEARAENADEVDEDADIPFGKEGEAATDDDFLLTAPTQDKFRREATEAEAKASRESAPPPEDFTLTGSNRTVDQTAARGQMELAPAPQPEAASASKEAGATAPKRKGTKAQREAEAVEAARADYFTPGNIVRGYDGFDRVLKYKAPEKPGGEWSVKVEAVRKDGDAWVAEGRPQDARWHSTQPDARELAKGPVERGKAATQDLAEASAKRTRPKGRIEFDSPVDQARARGQIEIGGEAAPQTLFGMSGAQIEAMQGGKMAGAEQFHGVAPTDEQRAAAEKRRADRQQAERDALDEASTDPRIAALREAGVEAGAVIKAAKELREGDDSLLRDLARIHDVNLPAPVDAAAAQAATSPKNDTPEPTEAQKDAGNYKKGHVRVSGLDITIENEAGTHRRPEWPALPAHYGYLKRTTGGDNEHIDVFVKPGTPEDFDGPVFVIDQNKADGTFDEHKVLLGYPNQPAAAKAYRDAYTKDWKGMGPIRRMTLDEFKTWLADGDTTAPAAQPAEAASATKERVPPEKKAEGEPTATQAQAERSDVAARLEKRNIWIPKMTPARLDRLLAKIEHTPEDIEDLKDFRYFLLTDLQSAREKGFYKEYEADGGSVTVLRNKFWLVNIDGAIATAESRPAKTEPASARVTRDSDLADGTTIYDGQGKPYRVHYQRNDLVVAHPIVDGKAQVSADTSVRFWVNPDRPASGENDRTDPIYTAPQGTLVARANAALKGKIEDVGEKIGGARKDVWNSFKDAMQEAEGLDVATAPLSKSWPAPDYQALLDGGSDPWAVAFMHAVRDEVPAKPRRAWKLKTWAAQVKMLRDLGMRAIDGRLDAEIVREKLAEAAKTSRGLTDVSGRADLYQLVGHGKSLAGVSITRGEYGIYQGVEYKPPKIIWTVEKQAAATSFSNWPRQLASGATRDEALANFKAKYAEMEISPPAGMEVSFEIFSKRSEEGYWIGKKIGRNAAPLEGPFLTIKDARTYKAEHNAELVAKLEKFKEIPNVRRDTNEPRVGEDMRGGQNVTSEMFKESFGFRGVEFGNYVEQTKRQRDLNDAFDALMDMAAILGVNPKALSLNGELGLAFGARGHGGTDAAAAHYERDFVVINLTKKDGAGSLGHEWWHALDNYFSRMRGKKSDMMTDALDVSLASRGSPFVHQGDVRKEMIEAFGEVLKSIRATAIRARAAKLDAKRTKDYWKTEVEMSARAFESYLIAKLQDQGASNDYLANIVDAETWAAAEKLGFELDGSYPYPLPGEVPTIRAGFDHFFHTIESRETDKGVAIYEPQAEYGTDGQQVITAQEGAYQTDLFGDPLPGPRGRALPQRSDGAGLRRDIRPAAGVQDTESPTGEYFTRTLIGSEVKRALGAAVIKTHADAARATSYLYRSAVERFDGIVTDENGKPLAVVGGFKGALSQATIHASTLVGEAIRVPGAARIWFSHNHPSGTAELSASDRHLNASLAQVFHGSGIEPMGLLAVAGDRYAFQGVKESGVTGDAESNLPVAGPKGRSEVPVIERTLSAGNVAGQAITNPIIAGSLAQTLYGRAKEAGLMLLNAQNQIVAWVPLSNNMLGPLRGTGGLRALYRAVSESSVGAAIMVHGGELDALPNMGGVSVIENIGAALRNVDVTPLDAINVTTGKSLVESGGSMSAGPVFSRSEGTRQAYEARIDELFAGEKAAGPREGVRVLDRSDVLDMLGLGDGPVHLAEGKVIRGQEGHPRMTAAVWKKVPDWLENPAAVFDSDTVPGTLVLIAPEVINGSTVRMTVEPRKDGGVDVHVLTNAYDAPGFTPFARWFRDGLARYVDQKEFPGALERSGLRLPSSAFQNKPGTDRILSEKSLAGYRRNRGGAMSRGAGRTGMEQAEVTRIADAVRAAWANGPDVIVLGSIAEAPTEVREQDAAARSKGAGKTEGFWHDGKVYLVADALPTAADVVRVLAHEALGHYGLRGLFGERLGAILDQIVNVRRGEIAKKVREYGLPDTKAGRRVAAEEVLAVMAQTNPQAGFVKKAIAAIRQWLRKMGFAIKVTDADIIAQMIVPARTFVERGGAVGSGAGTAFSRLLSAPIWFSPLARAIEGINAKAQPAQSWIQQITALKGVKPDEIEWSGVNEWLALQQTKVTKDAILEYLAGNGVKVDETVLGDDVRPAGSESELTAEQVEIHDDPEDSGFWTADAPNANRLIAKKFYPTEDAAREFALRYFNSQIAERNRERAAAAGVVPKFGTYRVPGQAENYRELLLTLPVQPPFTQTALHARKAVFDRYAERIEAARRNVDALQARGGAWQDALEEMRALEGERDAEAERVGPETGGEGKAFRSGHWDQPNVIAHVRIDERRDADGKRVLFVNELQSDWGQRGRKHGFKTADRLIDGHDYDWWSREADRLMSAKPFDRDAAMRAAENRNALAGKPDEVARGPFVEKTDAWVALALKRVIRYAVDNGFERVALVNGDQAADMFDLSNHVKRIYYDKQGDQYVLSADARGGGEIFTGKKQFSADELQGVVGKEVAQRIIDGEGRADEDGGGRVLEGIDLKVGGEGMRGFYDQIVPKVLKDVLKKLGGPAPTTVQIPVPGGTGRTMEVDRGPFFGGRQTIRIADELPMAQLGFEITAELRDRAAGPLPMFSRRPSVQSVQRAVGQAAQAIKGETLKSTWQQVVNAWKDKKPLALQLLGRRQLADIYGKMLPEIVDYSHRMQQYDADKNEASASADEIVNDWRKLPDADALADVMHGATLARFDPAQGEVKGMTTEMSAVLGAYQALTPEAKAIYARAKRAYASHWALVKQAISERIERAHIAENERRELMEMYRDHFLQPIEGVYFPLARFGDYIITAKDAQGQKVVVFAETLNEAQREQTRMKGELNDVSKITKRKEYNASQDAVSKEFVRKLFDAIDETAVDGNEADMLKDSINQLYLTSLPDVSWAKHGIHRKGTPGYNKDARRAFAASMFHGGYHLAKLRHADVLQDYLRAAQERIDAEAGNEQFDSVTAQQVMDEMVKRHDFTMNPDNNALANRLTALGFIWHLGLSPASAIVNLSQTALVAYPIIAARFGHGKTAIALAKASKEAMQARNDLRGRYAGDEAGALDRAIREGLIDITQAHDLAGIAEGRDSQLQGAFSPVMRAASWMFHQAEKFNRQATFMAAYRLARATGENPEVAYETARDLTYKGHFDYASSNRARVMMGPAARVLLLFKQYGQNMIYTIGRNAVLAAKGDREALKALSGLLVAHGLVAGTLGLPLAGVLMGLASILGSDDDEPWDAETAYRNYLADTFGKGVGEVIAKGVFRSIFPGDISSRVGLDQLLIRDIDLSMEPGKIWQELLNTVIGPVFGIGLNVAKGAGDLARGDILRGVQGMLPKAIADGVKTLRYSQEGVKDRTGVDVLDDVTAQDLLAQVTGFSPARVSEAYAGRTAVVGHKSKLDERKNELLRDFSRAVIQKDNESRLKALQEIQHFNQTNPKLSINSQSMLHSVQNRMRRQNEAQNGIYLPRKQRDLIELGRFANTQ